MLLTGLQNRVLLLRRDKRFIELDRALLAVVPLWEAEVRVRATVCAPTLAFKTGKYRGKLLRIRPWEAEIDLGESKLTRGGQTVNG